MGAWLVAVVLQALELRSQVGLSTRVGDVVLAGPELEVAPLERDAPLIVRIMRVAPHGDAFRYDFEIVALEPGTHALERYLRRKDGGALGEIDAPRLTAASSLAEGRVLPNPPAAGDALALGGYTRSLWIGGALWLAGLAAILFAGRRRRARAAQAARPRSLAERLEPLVERALAGELGREERAALELGLVNYWSQRLGFERERPELVLPRLRAHPEAGPLLLGLERWLHSPGRAEVDVQSLLAPYRGIAADALTLEPAARGGG